ncbi:MAG: hypothetical protein AABZ30_06770 [Myxococcota bacterium]
MHVRKKPKPDPATLDALTAHLRGLLGEESANAWDIGHALLAVEAGAYAARHRTFDEYIEKELGYARGRAYTLKRLAKIFEREAVVACGWSKLDLVLRIWEIIPGAEDPQKVGEFDFPMADGSTRRLDALSQDDLEAMNVRLRDEAERGEVGKLPRAARGFVAQVRRAMRGVRGFRVYASVPRARSGVEDVRLALLGLPLRHASQVGGALREAARHAGLVRTGPRGQAPARGVKPKR